MFKNGNYYGNYKKYNAKKELIKNEPFKEIYFLYYFHIAEQSALSQNEDGLVYYNKEKLFTGRFQTKYDNNIVKYESYYFLGEKSGSTIEYYSNGKIKSFSTYRNNELNGIFKSWFENGNQKSYAIMEKNEPKGKCFTYHENGSPKTVENYINGVLQGEYIEYYENGNKKVEKYFSNGNIQPKTKYWSEYNEPISNNELIIGLWKADNPNRKHNLEYLDNGKLNCQIYDYGGFIFKYWDWWNYEGSWVFWGDTLKGYFHDRNLSEFCGVVKFYDTNHFIYYDLIKGGSTVYSKTDAFEKSRESIGLPSILEPFRKKSRKFVEN